MKKYGFRKWLRNWLNQSDGRIEKASNMSVSVRESETLSGEPLRINVYSANGGMIVETRTYDRQKDRNNTNLYIVNEGEDLGNELSKILTMASLSR
jgi:hypothetical protein